MSYIRNEIITGNGTSTLFTLSEKFCNGTCRITYNDEIFSEYREVIWNRILFDFIPSVTDIIKVSYYTQNEQKRLNAIRYATPRQVKLVSRVANIVSVDDLTIEKLIREAEQIIDGYCGFWKKNDSSQKLLFPRLEDEGLDKNYSAIPREITDATLSLVEQLFLQGAPTLESEVTEERIGDYSYKKTSVQTDLIPEKVRLLLRGFRKLTGKVNIKTE